ncbi:MAG: MFS transporter [Rhodospirillaceae bacterium]|nr:MFS transporter [Rhodospirillaceae bacterium]
MAAPASGQPAAAGPWAPLKTRAFAVIWLAMLVSNIGMWARDVASGWMMTELSPSALMVALVQAALTLPVFLLSLPAGALADIVDRRKLLIAVQAFIALVSAALAAAAATGALTPALLLALTACGGIGAALAQPAFQSVVPELVDRAMLRPAVALNSLGTNIARAIGPALGGAVLAAAGVAAAYALDAVSTLVVVAAFLWWRRPQSAAALPPESFAPAMATALTYATRSGPLLRVLARAVLFFLFASAYWALLPLIARGQPDAGPTYYGVLLTAVGAGAVAGALALPWLSRRLNANALVLAGALASAAAVAALALPLDPRAVPAALMLAGGSWIVVLTNLNVTAQAVLPNWVRARGLAVYLMAFFGSMTAGSAVWGQLADARGLAFALFAAAIGGAVAALVGALVKLPAGDADLTPAGHWPEPPVAAPIAGERGPVLVEIVYQVDAADRAAFLAALNELARARRRDGGFGWRVFEDTEHPGRFSEVFYSASWLDHLRLHRRVTRDDAALQARVNAFHRGQHAPRVRHLVGARPDDVGPPAPEPTGHTD